MEFSVYVNSKLDANIEHRRVCVCEDLIISKQSLAYNSLKQLHISFIPHKVLQTCYGQTWPPITVLKMYF